VTQDRLRELLARARERLNAGSLDRDSHQLVAGVIRDIEIALGSGSAAAQAPRLQSLAARFEVAHPKLAETLRELVDALVRAGI
jgi:Domain of unknown function (DUF4404)